MCFSTQMCQALNLQGLIKSAQQVEATTCFRDREGEGSGEVKVTEQVAKSGTESTCFMTVQDQEEMGGKGRTEKAESMKEFAQEHINTG